MGERGRALPSLLAECARSLHSRQRLTMATDLRASPGPSTAPHAPLSALRSRLEGCRSLQGAAPGAGPVTGGRRAGWHSHMDTRHPAATHLPTGAASAAPARRAADERRRLGRPQTFQSPMLLPAHSGWAAWGPLALACIWPWATQQDGKHVEALARSLASSTAHCWQVAAAPPHLLRVICVVHRDEAALMGGWAVMQRSLVQQLHQVMHTAAAGQAPECPPRLTSAWPPPRCPLTGPRSAAGGAPPQGAAPASGTTAAARRWVGAATNPAAAARHRSGCSTSPSRVPA